MLELWSAIKAGFQGLLATLWLRRAPIDEPETEAQQEGGEEPSGVPEDIPPIPTPTPPKPKPAVPYPQKAFHEHVYHFHIETVLNHIDDHLHWLDRFRVWGPTLWEMTSRLGCLLCPRYCDYDDEHEHEQRSWLPLLSDRIPRDPEHWPSLLLSSWDSGWDTKHMYHAKLVIMQKVGCPSGVIPWGKVTYYCVVFWSKKGRKREDRPFEYYVGVDESGHIEPLLMICDRHQRIRHRDREGGITVLNHHEMAIPQIVQLMAKQQDLTPQEWCYSMLVSSLNECIDAECDGAVQVNVRHGERTCRFAIPVKRTPVFFKNRELTINAKGKKARIFHAVGAHERTLPKGKTVDVCSHYRGLRKFMWKGHEICITVPGHHHSGISEFDGLMWEKAPSRKDRRNMVTGKQMSREVTRYIWTTDAHVDHGEVIRDEFVSRFDKAERPHESPGARH